MSESSFATRLQAAWLRRGPLALALWPVSLVYGALQGIRRIVYRLGWLAQERLPGHVDRDHRSRPADPHPVKGPDRLSMPAAECGEVVPADQHRRAFRLFGAGAGEIGQRHHGGGDGRAAADH